MTRQIIFRCSATNRRLFVVDHTRLLRNKTHTSHICPILVLQEDDAKAEEAKKAADSKEEEDDDDEAE